jgi:hypothetical protein
MERVMGIEPNEHQIPHFQVFCDLQTKGIVRQTKGFV